MSCSSFNWPREEKNENRALWKTTSQMISSCKPTRTHHKSKMVKRHWFQALLLHGMTKNRSKPPSLPMWTALTRTWWQWQPQLWVPSAMHYTRHHLAGPQCILSHSQVRKQRPQGQSQPAQGCTAYNHKQTPTCLSPESVLPPQISYLSPVQRGLFFWLRQKNDLSIVDSEILKVLSNSKVSTNLGTEKLLWWNFLYVHRQACQRAPSCSAAISI